MRKFLFLFAFFLYLLFHSSPALASIGIGMGPSRLELEAVIGKSYQFNVVVYNPGDYDVRATIVTKCQTCVSNFTLFGKKLGEIREDYTQFFRFDPTDVYVPNHTNVGAGEISINVYVTPKAFVKKTLVFSTPESVNFLVRSIYPNYPGEFGIPYFTVLRDDKYIKAQIGTSVYWSTFGAMGAVPAVGVPLNMHIKGVPTGSIIIIAFIALLIVALVLWKMGFIRMEKRKPE